jgi:hypothetical protein
MLFIPVYNKFFGRGRLDRKEGVTENLDRR